MQVFLKTWSSFWSWWIANLCLIFKLTKKNNAKPALEKHSILVGRSTYKLSKSDSDFTEFAEVETLLDEMSSSATHYKSGVNIVFEEGQFLYRRLTDKILPDYRISELADIDLISQTPFQHDKVYLIPDSTHGGGHGYYILKKVILDPLIDHLKENRIEPKLLSFKTEEVTKILPLEKVTGKRQHNGFVGSFVKVLVACVVFVSVLTLAHFHWRYTVANNELDQQIISINKDVKKVRSIVADQRALGDRLKNVLDLKQSSASSIEVWEEFSKILPDSSWLSVLKVSDGIVTATGFSKNASSLIETIDGSTIFSNAAFDGPVVSIAGKNVQRFTIRVSLDR